MMFAMSRVWLAIALAISVAACDAPPDAEARLLCTTVCRCIEAPLPSIQDQCVEQCVRSGDIDNASQVCSECIFTHADRCGSLIADCDPLCDRPRPDPTGDNPDASFGGGN
jgi:hypothetical protein